MAVATVNSDGSLNTEATSIYHSTTDKSYDNGLDKDAFLQLLVAEMQNQDPLEPSSNTEYVAQLATFTQVEEMQNMANSMAQNQANALVGKTVIMNTITASGTTSYVGGVVDRIVNSNGKTYVGIDGSLYDINDLNSILNTDYYKITNNSSSGSNSSTSGGTSSDKTTTDTDKKTDTSDKTTTDTKTDTTDKTESSDSKKDDTTDSTAKA
ncbi:MAG: flagellar hook capping FlgD N-terminal domain-containing protein [Clostridia bacterium]|nr:flagellar hook capping FlgD N-terminal domain-containing protein [Clostridia bacterium]